MNSDPSKKLTILLKKLRQTYADEPAPAPLDEFLELDSITRQFIFSVLLWEANSTQARAACRKLADTFVDGNELRIAFDDEISHAIGDKYPFSLDRSGRLRAALNDVYRRFHSVTLGSISELNKRDIRNQLESIEGVPAFVAARTASLCFGCHAIPVDERLRALLAEEGIADEVTSVESVQHWLERSVAAEDGPEVAILLQHWSDDKGHVPKREPKPVPPKPKPAAKAPAKPPAKAGDKSAEKPPKKSETTKPATKKSAGRSKA